MFSKNISIVDCNGRVSRLFMNSGYNLAIISRLKYYEALDKVHTIGNYTYFIE